MRTPPTGREAARSRFPARVSAANWMATTQSRDEVWERLTHAPFGEDNVHTQKLRLRGLTHLLDWLEAQPGRTWQDRWLASGADRAGPAWRTIPARWLHTHGLVAEWRLDALASALLPAISADLVRPALGWLVTKATRPRQPRAPPGPRSRPGRVRPAAGLVRNRPSRVHGGAQPHPLSRRRDPRGQGRAAG
ncbi:MAG: hypothetical protein ACRDS0_33160 [Pseudonocardiaceae bacterium]